MTIAVVFILNINNYGGGGGELLFSGPQPLRQ